ncbi:terminase gpA endonuclease subunit [Hyphomonas pacifica]|uniref:Terminase n=1 Tax=Hyphomonas pacifica TaxID=1280941 RepID=A0A8B2PFX3_9PROT|nr:terminase gpA endonuclease subunit [Hyphomonas pacifica]RAN30644.1 hypothetical protein HY3_05700 [Hyphomonas pacifica]
MSKAFGELIHGASIVFAAAAIAAAPPPELTVSEWADAYRMISAESGSKYPGKWRTDRVPYLREPMDCMGVNHPSRRVAIRAGAQVGKTQAMNNALGHMVDTAPRGAVLMAPSLDKCLAWNREQFEPMLDVTDQLKLKVLASRSRSEEGSSTRFKRFRGGFLKLVSASTAKELQSTTAGLLILEEPTDYPYDTDGRGDPIDQARHRLDAWGEDGKEIAASTPGDKGSCRISEMYEAGDQRLFYLACKDCGDFSPLYFEHMHCDAPKSASDDPAPYFVRPCCGGIMQQGDLAQALATGVWLATYESEDKDNPAPPLSVPAGEIQHWKSRGREGRNPSFHLWQAYSPFASWRSIWADWKAGQAAPDKLRTFYQQVLAEPFEPAMDRPKAERLVELARHPATEKLVELKRGVIPPWAWVLTGAADVQTDRIEWAAYAWGPVSDQDFPPGHGEIAPGVPATNGALVDWGVIDISPDDPRSWAELANLSNRSFPGVACRPLTFDQFGVDTGGHYTQKSYQVASRNLGIKALKGHNDREAAPLTLGKRVRVAAGKLTGKVQLWLVGGHNLKRRIYHGLGQAFTSVDMGADPGAMAAGVRGTGRREPGSLFLPPEVDEAFAKQLTAEYLSEEIVRGKRTMIWKKPKSASNEQLDMAVYATSLAIHFGIDRFKRESWAALAEARRKPEEDPAAGPMEALWSGNGDTAPDPADEAEEPDKPLVIPEKRVTNPGPANARGLPAWARAMKQNNQT